MFMRNEKTKLGRREAVKLFGMGSAAGILGLLSAPMSAAAKEEERAKNTYAGKGMPPVTIRSVKAIGTAPGGSNLVIVKVETSEPGLYGLGCATFTQRAAVVVPAIDIYLNEFCKGRDVDNIDDMWMSAYVSSYWRNGPVLNNALSGLDMALWDIKGKRANLPVYQLLGGKCRFAVDCYAHSSGRDLKELEASVKQNMEQKFWHIRIQLAGYRSPKRSKDADSKDAGFGLPKYTLMDAQPCLKATPRMFEHIRSTCGDDIELLHDMHERVEPRDAIRLLKELERYRPFFVED